MEIKNVKVYGLEESMIRSGYPMQVGDVEDMNDIFDERRFELSEYIYGDGEESKDYNRSKKLAKTPVGSGHNNFLKGIIVQFDLKYPQYFTPQLQRYHWVDIVSSQSKMHRITSIKKIIDSCNNFVLNSHADDIDELIEVYNNNVWPYIKSDVWPEVKSQKECFQYIISNLPMGYEMWMGISTNYLQLKTIYNQRKNHKLKEDWGYFCDWIKTLPFSNLITE